MNTFTGDHFLNITPAAQTLRETINKCFLPKLRSFCKTKDMVNKDKTSAYRMRKDLNNPISYRGVISKMYKELKKLDIKKSSKSI